MKPKEKAVVELTMKSDEFDRMMRGALEAKPTPHKYGRAMKSSDGKQRGKRKKR